MEEGGCFCRLHQHHFLWGLKPSRAERRVEPCAASLTFGATAGRGAFPPECQVGPLSQASPPAGRPSCSAEGTEHLLPHRDCLPRAPGPLGPAWAESLAALAALWGLAGGHLRRPFQAEGKVAGWPWKETVLLPSLLG